MTKEEFYTKWQPNGFYTHNPVEFMTDLESVIKTEQSRQADVSGNEVALTFEHRQCPSCSLNIQLEDKFCSHCGVKFKWQ